MRFKKIELHGFKSFAEQVNIEFHEGITCIVGPNGSGKSNISDAIRWVLGEQSPKSLRGGKMEDVIFAGTANRKSRGMAEVTLTIDNSSHFLPIDFSEVAITRKMYRSGESEYFINNNICRLKDIKELIMDTGIGVDGYSIIGQGKISDIIGSKPEGRREIFEEVAGIVKYRAKKNEAEKKLESTNQNLTRVNDIIGEIESRIDGLREDSIRAKEYLELKETYKNVEINITLKNINNIELKNEYLKDELLGLTNEIEKYQDEKAELDKEYLENRNKNEEIEKNARETQEKLMALINEINTLKNQNELNSERIISINKDEDRLAEEIANLDIKLANEMNVCAESKANGEAVEFQYQVLTKELNEKKSGYTEKSNQVNSQMSQIESEKGKAFDLYNLITIKKTEIGSIENLKNTLVKRKNQITVEREQIASIHLETKNRYDRALIDRNSLNEKLQSIDKKQLEIKEHHQTKAELEKNLAVTMDNLKTEMNETATRKKLIEEMENSYEGYNHAVKFIMKNVSGIPGIHGVVAELIEVPQGYETAIETALGQAMQNIICEDDVSAQRAIELLKSNKAGRLTFLPIKSIRSNPINYNRQTEKADGFKGFAVECVKYSSIYSHIMSYLLGKVVIVDNLKNAVKLSKSLGQGFRIVTLEGDVINPSGAITGGSVRNNTGNILERKATAKRLTEKLDEVKVKFDKIYKEITELRSEINRETEELYGLSKDYRETEMSLVSCNAELHKLENELNNYKDSEIKWQKELDDIEREEKEANDMIVSLECQASDAEQNAKNIEKLTDENLKQYEQNKKLLEALNAEITDIKLKLVSIEGERANIASTVIRIEKYMAELTAEKELKAETIAELRIQRQNIEENINETQTAMTEKNNEKDELEFLLKKNQEQKDYLSNFMIEVSKRKENLDEQIYNLQTQKHELDLKIAKNEAQVDSYKDKLWDEFEISFIQAIEFKKKDFAMASAMRDAKQIKDKIKGLGEVNIGSIKEYEVVSERYDFLTEQRDDLLTAIDSLNTIIEDMDKTIKISFKENFVKVAHNFEIIFKELFGGGTAELRLEDETKLLDTGIEIVAQPPGKKLQTISLLSGGEKTLTAIALMFAVIKVKPTPFCILDEIEAALDEMNISRFAQYLTNFNNIQFVLVTHQKATMEFADVLYGVTMPEQGISKVISLKLAEAVNTQ